MGSVEHIMQKVNENFQIFSTKRRCLELSVSHGLDTKIALMI